MDAGAERTQFETAAADHDVTVTRTRAANFASTLEGVVEYPAVGVSLPIDGVSLADTAVETTLTPAKLDTARTGVTPVSFGIATLGTVFIESTADGAEPVSLFPERHVAVLAASDVCPDLAAAVDRFGEELAAGPSSGVFASGPSATADMGGHVQGVHGPSDVHVIVVDDR
ncbi:hypothetical protein HTSR_1052 [Halodesulfurarchaeum formicicum]|uniref:LUD domain-containing protein n=1 Tax=Halodesulfurarchaeum formicicum TaxID=1873524 RepID=A0A1D8S4F3_9EURY|nr:LUD domain-containing protein [Halodesulfurarchaeum formicicum]AOW80234.1 hypothetical protein HTSR_1052 [Halodesulfurarchaeum formicicum]